MRPVVLFILLVTIIADSVTALRVSNRGGAIHDDDSDGIDTDLPPPEDLPACVKKGKQILPQWTLLRKQNTPDLGTCRAECLAFAVCVIFSYNYQTRECILGFAEESKDSEGSYTAKVDCVIRGSAGAAPCLQKGLAYESTTLQAIPADFLEDCATLCKNTTSCHAFTYKTKEKECQLKASAEGPTTRLITAVSAPVGCEIPGAGELPFCIEPKVSFDVKPFKLIKAKSLYGCALLCRDTPECNSYNYDITKQECSLNREYGGKSLNLNHYSGVKSCQPSGNIGCIEYNIGISGHTIFEVKTDTIDECRKECLQRLGCRFYTYNILSKYCYLKDTDKDKRGWEADVTGSVDCQLTPAVPCLLIDYAYTTRTLEIVPNIRSTRICKEHCESLDACQYFTHDTITKECFLKKGGKMGVPRTGARSASRQCIFDGRGPCAQVDKLVISGDLEKPFKVESVDDCASSCRGNSECYYYSYESKKSMCTVSGGNGRTVDAPGFVSSRKGCYSL